MEYPKRDIIEDAPRHLIPWLCQGFQRGRPPFGNPLVGGPLQVSSHTVYTAAECCIAVYVVFGVYCGIAVFVLRTGLDWGIRLEAALSCYVAQWRIVNLPCTQKGHL